MTVPDSLVDELVLSCDLPDHGEQKPDRVLSDLVHRRLGSVGHDNTQTRSLFDWNVVSAGTGTKNRPAFAQEREEPGGDHSRSAHRPDHIGISRGQGNFRGARACAFDELDPLLCQLWANPVGCGW